MTLKRIVAIFTLVCVSYTATNLKAQTAAARAQAASAKAKAAADQAAANAQMIATSPNADIFKMLQAGLPEGVIVNKVQEGAGRWDTSVDALIALKQAGATAAELDALTASPAPVVAVEAAAPAQRPAVPAFGGMLGFTPSGVPYIQFPAGVVTPTVSGAPSNTIFLMRDNGKPLLVIPSSFAGQNYFVPGGFHFHPVLQWTFSNEGNLLWSADGVRFEDICQIPDVTAGIKDKAEKEKRRENPGPIMDDFFAHRKQVVQIYTPLGFRDIDSLFYLGTLDKGKLVGHVFIVGLQGYTWPGRTNDEPAGAQYRSPELQAFIDKLIQQPQETIAAVVKAANLPEDASLWPPSFDYVYSTTESARHYSNINANFVAEFKAKQPITSGGGGFMSALNVMQGVQNMASAQSAVNAAAANHDMVGQLSAASSAVKAEMQTLNAISDPNAAPIQASNQTYAPHATTPVQPAAAPRKSVFTLPPPKPLPTPPPTPSTGTVGPIQCVDLGPGNCMPLAQWEQLQSQKGQQTPGTVICPASGFIAGTGHYAACDEFIGERLSCTPGQSVPIPPSAVPPASCGPVASTGSGPATGGNGGSSFGSGSSGGGNTNGSSGGGGSTGSKPIDARLNYCIGAFYRNDPISGTVLTLQNNCTVTAKVYWYSNPTDTGGVLLNPGEVENTYNQQSDILASGGVTIYACPQGDMPLGANGVPAINGQANAFDCVRQ